MLRAPSGSLTVPLMVKPAASAGAADGEHGAERERGEGEDERLVIIDRPGQRLSAAMGPVSTETPTKTA